MTSPVAIKLSDVLGRVQKPRFVLGTTYSLSLAFFESVVLPTLGDPSALHGCLIVCDKLGYRRALSEGAALYGAGQDYVVVPAPVAGAFHPKVWLVLGQEEAVLLVGSGNLTQAGFMTNAEMFEALHFHAENPAPTSLIQSVRGFLDGLSGMWPGQDADELLCVELLKRMADEIASIPTKMGDLGGDIRFIHSFAGRLLDQLPAAPDAGELSIAAPFFGGGVAGVKLWAQRYAAARIRVFPAVHSGDEVDLPIQDVKRLRKGTGVSRLCVAGKDGAFAHLKLYGIVSAEEAWLCCTSANCTEAAWCGPNIEAGILRSVAGETVAGYFTKDPEPLPPGRLLYRPEAEVAIPISVSASDTGVALELRLLDAGRASPPLRAATVIVRTGSLLCACHRDSLFHDGRSAHIAWSAFADWKREGRAALFLEIDATETAGHSVHAACFIENDQLLRAAPEDRRAYRGVQALLDSEGSPDYADVAALFFMSRKVFEGRFLAAANTPKPPSGSGGGKPPEDGDDLVALWPPRPDIAELARVVGRSSVNRIHWFQRIFGALLQDESRDGGQRGGGETDSDSEDGNVKAVAGGGDQGQAEKRALTLGQRLWKEAEAQIEWMRSRLKALCPTPQQAPNVWLGAVALFISCLAVYRAARRIAPDHDFGTDAHIMADDFLNLMLNKRRQPEDFCCNKWLRYREETFPPLADDLRHTFGVTLDPALTMFLLTLLADKKLRTAEDRYPQMWKRPLGQVCEPGFQADADSRLTAYRIWHRYLGDEPGAATEDLFNRAFDSLWALR